MRTRNRIRGEAGSALIVVLILLALLTIIGISATDMAVKEMNISGNDKNYKIALFKAESGVYGMVEWITPAINDGIPLDAAAAVAAGETPTHRFTYLAGGSLDAELNDPTAHDDAKDLSFTMDTDTVEVDVQRLRSELAEGGTMGGIGTGASGLGATSVVNIPFWLRTGMAAGSQTQAGVIARYIYVKSGGS